MAPRLPSGRLWHVLLKEPNKPLRVVVLKVEDGEEKRALSRALGAEKVEFFHSWNGVLAAYGAGPSVADKEPNVVHGHQIVRGPVLLVQMVRKLGPHCSPDCEGHPAIGGWTLEDASDLGKALNQSFRLDRKGVVSTGPRMRESAGVDQSAVLTFVEKKPGEKAAVGRAVSLGVALEGAGIPKDADPQIFGSFAFYDVKEGPLHLLLGTRPLRGNVVAVRLGPVDLEGELSVVSLSSKAAKKVGTFLDREASELPRILRERARWSARSVPTKVANEPRAVPKILGVLKEVGKPARLVRVPVNQITAYIEKTVGEFRLVQARIMGKLMLLSRGVEIDENDKVVRGGKLWLNFAIRSKVGVSYYTRGATLIFKANLDPIGDGHVHTLSDLRGPQEIGTLTRERAELVRAWVDKLAQRSSKDAREVLRLEKEYEASRDIG